MRAVATVTLAMAIALMSAPAALGCGDKLSVIGGGVGYDRLAGAGARGNVVLLLEPDSTLRAANDRFKLKRELEFAGHKVRVVQSSAALQSVLATAGADVVLVSWQDARRLQAELSASPSPPAVVSVAYEGDTGVAATDMPKGICVASAVKPRGREVVRAVGQTVEQRKSGQTVDC